ncbi:hypothetical protein IKQ21_02450, partial [bacterium]|nr:hypothetical protein [bacterium]
TSEETLGKTRYELLKLNNPHLVGEYAGVYNNVNAMLTNEVKEFADKVIEQVNKSSDTKLLDESGNYTEYGEYIIEYLGMDIAHHALLKSLSGEHFRAKVLNNGDLYYDIDKIKENTSLKALGINASNPKEEAEILQKLMKSGLKKLSDQDVDIVSKSILKRIEGTNVNSFRLDEAFRNKASLGPAIRLDAAKDLSDQDAVRNRESSFDDEFNKAIKFWRSFVQAIKAENPNAYIVAELTDIPDMMRFTYGQKSCPYDGNTNVNNCIFNGDIDAQTKFFNETGITTEAGYSYLFTNLLANFAPEFEKGEWTQDTHDAFKNRVDLIMQNRNPDYLRNLYTFIGNHDKTRTIQGLATDMRLFQSRISYTYNENGSINFDVESDQRQKVIQILSGVTNSKDVPIELRLNVDNMDYFRTISPKAVAQAKTLMYPVKEDLKDIVSQSDIDLITNAIVDLANGNYLSEKDTKSMTRINIPEISTLEGVVNQILNMAENHGFDLKPEARQYLLKSVLEQAEKLDINNYLVHGDFNWAQPNEKVSENNRQHLQEILGRDDDGSNYSLYTLQLARLVRDAYNNSKNGDYANPAFDNALIDFINKYNRSYVESRTSEPEKFESRDITRNKDSFGVKPFENVMDWVMNQAEFKSGKKFKNREEIVNRVVTSITEPAIQKQAMMLAYLSGLIGAPTVYAGDEYGMSGYDDKTKNRYLQNRNMVLRNGVNAKRYSKEINGALSARSDKTLQALNSGTPYEMDILVNGMNRDAVMKRLAEIRHLLDKTKPDKVTEDSLKQEQRQLSKELAKVSYMMYSSNGDAVVSVFYAGDVNHSNRHDYFADYGIKTESERQAFFKENNIENINPNNKYVPIQQKTELDAILLGAGISLPIGTLFVNANARDKAQYIVKEINGRRGIVRKDGGKIIMDGLTAKNGVMLLKRIKNILFKGNSYNASYNLVSNPYKTPETSVEGRNLSLISK